MRKIKYCALTTIAISMRQFVLPAALHLAKNGYDVTVGCAYDEDLSRNMPKELKYFPLNIERGYNLKKTLVSIKDLYVFFKKENIEMVEYGTENVSLCGAIAAWMARVPVRIYNHWGSRYVGFSGFARFFSLTIERLIALFSTDIRQPSEKNMQLCVADRVYPQKKVRVIGYGGTVGADFQKFDISLRGAYRNQIRAKYGIPQDALVFGDIGSIRRDKGSNELMEAFRQLNNSNAWLMLVGDIYEEDSPDKELLSWAQACERVVFTGRVMDVERYVAAFDLIVHPSYREGFGMVLQEAGAMGVPYITTDIPGPSEFGIEGVTGLLVKKANEQDLERKMEYFLQCPSTIREMSENVYNLTKERYERNIMVERILADRNALIEKISIN